MSYVDTTTYSRKVVLKIPRDVPNKLDSTQFRIIGDPIQFRISESELESNSEFSITLPSN
jgi:hypothetical protein